MNEKRERIVIELRDAALALLQRLGEPDPYREDALWFEMPTPMNPQPRLAILVVKHPRAGVQNLNVWAKHRGKYKKVLNVSWNNRGFGLTTFRRGDWETELLAMTRAAALSVH